MLYNMFFDVYIVSFMLYVPEYIFDSVPQV